MLPPSDAARALNPHLVARVNRAAHGQLIESATTDFLAQGLTVLPGGLLRLRKRGIDIEAAAHRRVEARALVARDGLMVEAPTALVKALLMVPAFAAPSCLSGRVVLPERR
jgi:hypothetical protein